MHGRKKEKTLSPADPSTLAKEVFQIIQMLQNQKTHHPARKRGRLALFDIILT